MIRHYVEFLYPGMIVADAAVVEVLSREPSVVSLPRGAYAFRFFDVVEGEIDGVEVCSKRRNMSKTYYPGGTLKTLEEVRQLPGNNTILISNMEVNLWPAVVFARNGNWCQPFDPAKDEIIPEPGHE